ncbi:hypothetical protein CBL_20633 [Carabus blaptoides fortunei]
MITLHNVSMSRVNSKTTNADMKTEGTTYKPVKKVDGDTKHIKVETHEFAGRHHVLPEGVSFPPERRTAMAQSIGPMTAYLSMIRSEGQYRKNWEDPVKRSMAMIKNSKGLAANSRNNETGLNKTVTIGPYSARRPQGGEVIQRYNLPPWDT